MLFCGEMIICMFHYNITQSLLVFFFSILVQPKGYHSYIPDRITNSTDRVALPGKLTPDNNRSMPLINKTKTIKHKFIKQIQ